MPGNCDPPIATRFPVNRPHAPHTQKGPYLTPLLKKLLSKEITVGDPEVKRILDLKLKDNKAPFKKLILLRWLLNATQGDNQAIEGILDRIDGKLGTNGNGKGGNVTVIVRIGDKSGLLGPAQAARVSPERVEV